MKLKILKLVQVKLFFLKQIQSNLVRIDDTKIIMNQYYQAKPLYPFKFPPSILPL